MRPVVRLASSLERAARPSRMASRGRTSMPALRLDRRAGTQRFGDPGEDRIADEHVERHHRVSRRNLPGALGERAMTDHQVRIRRDSGHGGVLDRHWQVLELFLQLGHHQCAAAHAGLAGQHDLVDVRGRDTAHAAVPAGSETDWLTSEVSVSRTVARSRAAATAKVTMQPTVIPARVEKMPPGGVIANSAKMLPGDGEATRPPPVATKVAIPEAPPRIMATIRIGRTRTSGKWTSWLPPR